MNLKTIEKIDQVTVRGTARWLPEPGDREGVLRWVSDEPLAPFGLSVSMRMTSECGRWIIMRTEPCKEENSTYVLNLMFC